MVSFQQKDKFVHTTFLRQPIQKQTDEQNKMFMWFWRKKSRRRMFSFWLWVKFYCFSLLLNSYWLLTTLPLHPNYTKLFPIVVETKLTTFTSSLFADIVLRDCFLALLTFLVFLFFEQRATEKLLISNNGNRVGFPSKLMKTRQQKSKFNYLPLLFLFDNLCCVLYKLRKCSSIFGEPPQKLVEIVCWFLFLCKSLTAFHFAFKYYSSLVWS